MDGRTTTITKSSYAKLEAYRHTKISAQSSKLRVGDDGGCTIIIIIIFLRDATTGRQAMSAGIRLTSKRRDQGECVMDSQIYLVPVIFVVNHSRQNFF